MAADGTSIQLAKIGQILVPVRDLPRAVAFYRDTLGMRFLFQAPPGLAFFDCGGVRLLLEAVKKGGAQALYILYYQVEDIQAIHALYLERGVHFTDAPHIVHQTDDMELWMAFLKDSEGNTLALMEERLK